MKTWAIFGIVIVLVGCIGVTLLQYISFKNSPNVQLETRGGALVLDDQGNPIPMSFLEVKSVEICGIGALSLIAIVVLIILGSRKVKGVEKVEKGPSSAQKEADSTGKTPGEAAVSDQEDKAQINLPESPQDETAIDFQSGSHENPIQLYNQCVRLFVAGQYESALEMSKKVYKGGEFPMQAAYLGALCQNKLGLEIDIPPELSDKVDEAGAVYMATNLACHLISKGHKAALTKQDTYSEVMTLIDGALYSIYVSGMLGGFSITPYRIEAGTKIYIKDSSLKQTSADKTIISLTEQAINMPPMVLPEGGLKTTWE